MNRKARMRAREAAAQAEMDRRYPLDPLSAAAGVAARFQLYRGYEKLNVLPEDAGS